jgi:hypothetical protein
LQPLLQGVEIGVGFFGCERDGGNAQPSEMGDEARHIHLGDMGGTHQGELTVAEQRRGQGGANAGSLQQPALLKSCKDGIGIVAVQNHHRAAPGLTQGLGRIVL